jgi:predicted nucleic acid-binding protein
MIAEPDTSAALSIVPHRGLEACMEPVDQFVELEALAAQALDLAGRAQRPLYDMYFVVLGRPHSAALLTADEPLSALARSIGIRPAG